MALETGGQAARGKRPLKAATHPKGLERVFSVSGSPLSSKGHGYFEQLLLCEPVAVAVRKYDNPNGE
jgi:hypothetical protein